MTPAGEILRDEIRRRGPLPFRRFMEIALYHPEHGYYRRSRDPFGKAGDFYTAEQVQPVFGRLIAATVRALVSEMAGADELTVVELGAGRQEMAEYFGEWRYVPIDSGTGEMPNRFRGVVFANEFFDALPVDSVGLRDGRFFERRVDYTGDRFAWTIGGEVNSAIAEHLAEFGAPLEEGGVIEVNLEARRAIRELAPRLEQGWLLVIDYGYTAREIVRFPAGTLMSYRRHQAIDDVLAKPGEQDISAHVNFTALSGHARAAGFDDVRLESMARMLLRAGECDNFEEVLRADNGAEAMRRRMQLKTLLYGMGETFRVLLARTK